MRKICIMFMVALLPTLAGCGTEDSSSYPEGESLRGIAVINNTVHFEDVAAFSEAMRVAHSMGVERLGEFEEIIGMENSLRSNLLANRDEEGDELNEHPVGYPHDLFFASVLNADGIFYLGDTIHKVTDDYEYALVGGDEESLNEILASRDGLPAHPGLKVHQITGDLGDEGKEGDAPQRVLTGMHTIIRDIGTDPSGNPKRVVMEAWSRNYLTYASNGVNLTTQSYRRGGLFGRKDWRDSAVYYLKVDVESRQYSSIAGVGSGWYVINSQEEAWSYHHIQEVMEYLVGTGVWLDTDYIDCTYTYVPDDGIQRDEFVHWVN